MKLVENVPMEIEKQIKDKIGSMSSDELNTFMDVPVIREDNVYYDDEKEPLEFNYDEIRDELSEENLLENVFREYVLQQLLDPKKFREAYNYAVGSKWMASPSNITDTTEGILVYFSEYSDFFESDLFKDYKEETLIPEMEDLVSEWEEENKFRSHEPRE